MMTIDAALRRQVRLRAGNRCEYCGLHQDELPFVAFHIEHVIARQHEGTDDESNLCLACHWCNFHIEAPCPVCKQTALLLIADYNEPDSEDLLGDPGYIVGLECFYCDVYIKDPELMERFHLAQLYDSVWADT